MTYIGNSASDTDMHIFYTGAWEKYILYLMRDVMRSLRPSDGVFVDVGAHKGHHSLFMSKYVAVVHAIEPYEKVLNVFRKMIAINKITNIKIHPIGLGEESKTLTFYEPPQKNTGTGTFVRSYLEDKIKGGELPIVRGDDLFEKSRVTRVDMLKIDIEGYEKPALRGLVKTLKSSRPIVVFEITIDPQISTFFRSKQDILDAFPRDYHVKAILGKNQTGWVDGKYTLAELDDDFSEPKQYDLIAYPTEKAGHIPNVSVLPSR